MAPALLVLIGFASSSARAGPPLLSDDPNTIGPGRVEWIVAAQTAGEPTTDLVEVPLFDLTIGLLDGLDFVVTGAPAFVFESTDGEETQANVVVGFKWQPLDRPDLALAFTPAVGLDVLSGQNPYFYLPMQVERRFGAFALGVDGGYGFVRDDFDLWNANVYGTWQLQPTLVALAEVWAISSPGLQGTDFGTGLGLEWTFHPALSALAMAGTGIASERHDRVQWVGYLGVRWAFALWTPRGPTPAPGPPLGRLSAD